MFKTNLVSSVYLECTASTYTFISASHDVIDVCLNLTKDSFLGVSIYGQCSNDDNAIYVGSIMDHGVVHQDGRINVGDMILQVFGPLKLTFWTSNNGPLLFKGKRRELRESFKR